MLPPGHMQAMPVTVSVKSHLWKRGSRGPPQSGPAEEVGWPAWALALWSALPVPSYAYRV